MTEPHPEHPSPPTQPNDTSARTPPRKPRVLLATTLLVLLVIGVSTAGGYLWGHNDRANTHAGLGTNHNHLTQTRHALLQMRIDLDKAISALVARNRRLQDDNRELGLRVTDRRTALPHF